MVQKKMYERIQELKQKGFGTFQISEKLKLDPATVRKYYSMSYKEYIEYQTQTRERYKSFDSLKSEILQIYEQNNFQKLNMAAVYDYLDESNATLPGGERSLRNYVHFLEQTGELTYKAKQRMYQKVPELPYGKQMQLDFGVFKKPGQQTLYIFASLLSASRFKFVKLQATPFTTFDVINHLLDSFDYFEGIPKELVIDQDSTLVVDQNLGDFIYTEKFKEFLDEMNLEMFVCHKSDPETKGKVENLVKYVKYSFLQIRNFSSVDDANASLLKWLNRRANGKISQATKKVPLIAIEEERQHLRPVKNSIFRKESLKGREHRVVTDKSYITVDTNEYSVPVEYKQRTVEIFKTEDDLFIFDSETQEEIAKHQLSLSKNKRIGNREHFRYKKHSISELKHTVTTMFTFHQWNDFVEQCYSAFSRFFRDQAHYAFKHFSNDINSKLLNDAVNFCLENKNYSMKDLNDTYLYFLNEQQLDDEKLLHLDDEKVHIKRHGTLNVEIRDLQQYESILNGGVR